ncbi:MAG: c-type cytochrome [Beijerinckiaceae bacterium]
MMLRFALLAAASLLAGPALAQSAAQRGAALVKQHCAACHAIGATGESPNAKAPPLREIARKYRAEDLEEAFAEGVMVSHQATDMPPFAMEPAQVQSLTAYLRSLRGAKP